MAFTVNSPGHLAEHNRLQTAVPAVAQSVGNMLRDDGTWVSLDASTAGLVAESGSQTSAQVASMIAGKSAVADTPNMIAVRDANGRAQFADPAGVQDVATLGWVGNTYFPLDTDARMRFAAAKLPNTRRTFAAVRLNHAPSRVLCIGDSTTAGVYSDSYTTAIGTTNQGGPNSYPAQLAAQLNAAGLASFYGLAIPGHAGNDDSRWSLGSWIYNPFGAGVSAALKGTAAGPVVLTPGVAADTYRIYFYADSSTGTMTAQATGGAVSATFGTNTTAGIYTITVTASAVSASNTVTVNWVSGIVFVLAVEWSDSTHPNRVSIGNAGVGGSRATQWNSTINAGPINLIKAYAPDLTIISLGINDAGNGVTLSAFTAAMTTIINAAQISGDVLLMAAVPHSAASALDPFNAALRAANGVPSLAYVDLFARYGYNMLAQGMQCNDGTPATHPNALGYSDVANAVASTLLMT